MCSIVKPPGAQYACCGIDLDHNKLTVISTSPLSKKRYDIETTIPDQGAYVLVHDMEDTSAVNFNCITEGASGVAVRQLRNGKPAGDSINCVDDSTKSVAGITGGTNQRVGADKELQVHALCFWLVRKCMECRKICECSASV